MGHTKEQVVEIREELAREKAMTMSLETYLQALADEKTRLEAEIAARGPASEAPRQQRAQTPAEPETSASRSQTRGSAARPTTQKTEGRKNAESTSWKQKTESDVKSVLPEQKFSPASANVDSVTTDYLADINEDCVVQMQGVNATTRLRQAAVTDFKTFDGRSRNENRGKGWLSSVRAAFRRDQLSAGEACLQFPDLLTDKA
ncbi:hypothetical protein PINS_up016449 [Pythium insidiosum]|nr:hypothetical protein PINS_up016449 [Pythium insidiosum]